MEFMVNMFQIPAALMLYLLCTPIPGAQGSPAGSPPDDPVSVVSCLDQALLDFLASELDVEGGGITFTRAQEDRIVLDRMRSLQPSEFPDILFGVSTLVLAQLADQGFLDPCEPPWGSEIPVGLADRDHRWYGVFGDPITIAYNHQYFADGDLLEYLPKGWETLGDPRYKGSLVLENPSRYNVSGYFFACLIDRAEQRHKNRDEGFELLAKIDRNHFRYTSFREEILKPDMLFSGGAGTITVTLMSDVEQCAGSGLPVDLVLPAEGLFLYPRGIALVKGASDKARNLYAALVERERLRRCAKAHPCFPLIFKDTYSFSLWPGEQFSLEIFPTDHDAVSRNINSWIGTWQSLYRGRRKKKLDSIDDAINTTMTFLIPLIILIIILTSRSRRRQSAKRIDR